MTEQERRTARAGCLAAFDIYKSNVSYGLVEETEEEHGATAFWYHRLLDLPDEEAVYTVGIPAKVASYLPRLR